MAARLPLEEKILVRPQARQQIIGINIHKQGISFLLIWVYACPVWQRGKRQIQRIKLRVPERQKSGWK